MTRKTYCQLLLREIYGGPPSDDAKITINQVNLLLNPAVATAAKTNFIENKKADNIEYVNDSFYLTFNNISITRDYSENFLYKLTLPHIPFAIGSNMGIDTAYVTAPDGATSQPFIFLSASEWARKKNGRKMPNKIICNNEGKTLKIESTLLLSNYKGTVKMISSGSSIDLSSEINVPEDYFKQILAYIKEELAFERAQPVDVVNDGRDKP